MPALPRRGRCLLPGVACHVTQRGVDRRETFSADQDRHTYLRLLRENLGDAQVSLLAWCLMSNHVHLVMVPAREDSLSILLRRVHGRYAQYYNACRGRSGHLWQNRYFGCMLEPAHLCPPVPPLLSRWENRAVQAVPFSPGADSYRAIRAAGGKNRQRRVVGGQEKTMSTRKLTLLIFAVTLLAEPSFAQQKGESSPCMAEYENHNQIDYGPLIIQKVKGTITDPQQGAVPKACVGIFTEKDHKLVATTESGADGKFSLQSVPPGRYRLVVKADPLCVANVPLQVVKSQKKKQVLRVHMKPRGLDSCSYADLGAAEVK